MMVVVRAKTHGVMIALLAALAGCKQDAQPLVQPKQQKVAAASAPPAVETPKNSGTAPVEDCSGVNAYPLPRSYRQILSDVPPGNRKPTTSLEAKVMIGPEGNVTHLRFTRLSTLDSINKSAIESVKSRHYKPTVLNGQRVSVCSTVSIIVDLQ